MLREDFTGKRIFLAPVIRARKVMEIVPIAARVFKVRVNGQF
jgi:hypothetical protein